MFEEAVFHAPTTYIVVDETHHHASPCPCDKRIGHQTAQGIVLEDVHVDVNMVAGLGDVLQQFREIGIAVGHDVNLVVAEGQRQVLVDKEVDELFLRLGQSQVLLFHEAQHGALGQLVHLPLVYQPLAAVVDAKEQVEHDAHDGCEDYHQHPGHRLGRLSIVYQHMDAADGYQ